MTATTRAALLLVSFLALASQACGQEPGAAASQANRTKGMGGEVHCVNGAAQLEPPLPQLQGYERAENIRHEAVHAAQFESDCAQTAHLWETDPGYRLALEAEATCVGIKAWPTDSLRRFRKGLAAARIAQSYLASKGNTVGFEDVYAALDDWCGG